MNTPAEASDAKPDRIASASRIALIVLGTLAVLYTLHLMRAVLIPVAIGLLITYPLEPVVAWLARRRVPRSLGSALVLLLTLAPLSLAGYALSSEVAAIADRLPVAAKRITREVERMRRSGTGPLHKVQETATVLEQSASKVEGSKAPAPGVTRVEVQPPKFSATDLLWSGSIGAITVGGNVLMTLFLIYFMLASGDLYRRKLAKIAGRAQQKLTGEILDDINSRIGRYLLALLTSNVVVSLVSWAAFTWLDLDQALTWAVVAGSLNTIPYFGPVLVTIAIGVVAGVQFGTLAKIAAVCGAALAITAIEGWVLTPLLMGKAAKMNAVAIFVSLLVWTWIWGVWGTLLAVPMMTILKAVSDRVEGLDWVGELLGE